MSQAQDAVAASFRKRRGTSSSPTFPFLPVNAKVLTGGNMGKDFFTTASFGKRVEYVVIAKMLRSGLDVYLPMVDDKGIDCLVRMDDGSVAEIQIKGRSKNCEIASSGRFSAMSIEPRPRYYMVFYSEACEDGSIWLMPSLEFAKLAIRNKGGKNEGKYSIVLCGARKDKDGNRKPYALERFDKYRVRGDFLEEMFKENI